MGKTLEIDRQHAGEGSTRRGRGMTYVVLGLALLLIGLGVAGFTLTLAGGRSGLSGRGETLWTESPSTESTGSTSSTISAERPPDDEKAVLFFSGFFLLAGGFALWVAMEGLGHYEWDSGGLRRRSPIKSWELSWGELTDYRYEGNLRWRLTDSLGRRRTASLMFSAAPQELGDELERRLAPLREARVDEILRTGRYLWKHGPWWFPIVRIRLEGERLVQTGINGRGEVRLPELEFAEEKPHSVNGMPMGSIVTLLGSRGKKEIQIPPQRDCDLLLALVWRLAPQVRWIRSGKVTASMDPDELRIRIERARKRLGYQTRVAPALILLLALIFAGSTAAGVHKKGWSPEQKASTAKSGAALVILAGLIGSQTWRTRRTIRRWEALLGRTENERG